jgi:hypothetical protein
VGCGPASREVPDAIRQAVAGPRTSGSVDASCPENAGLIKAFLKAGVLGEDQVMRDTVTGTPQGGLCSAEYNPPYEQCLVMRSADL